MLNESNEIDEIVKAKSGNVESQYKLGIHYIQTAQGNKDLIDEGIHWLRLAALRGHRKSKIAMKNIARQLQSMGLTPDVRFDVVETYQPGCFSLILLLILPAGAYAGISYLF